MYASDLTHEFYAHFRRLIRRRYWSSFLSIISDDYHLRPAALQIQSVGGSATQHYQNTTLLALRYYPEGYTSTLTLTLQYRREVYTHRILNPSQIEAFYEPHGQIFALAITNQRRERALLFFNDSEVAPQPAKIPIRTWGPSDKVIAANPEPIAIH